MNTARDVTSTPDHRCMDAYVVPIPIRGKSAYRTQGNKQWELVRSCSKFLVSAMWAGSLHVVNRAATA